MRTEAGNSLHVVRGPNSAMARLPTPLCQEEILGIIWAAAGRVRVPVRCFPMQVALDVLDQTVPASGRLRRALASWPKAVTSAGMSHAGMDQTLQALRFSHLILAEGRGWDAGYRPSEAWFEQCCATLAGLGKGEYNAVCGAAQRLVACLTTWSKKSRASLPNRSFTS
jgi:hypothetical protein